MTTRAPIALVTGANSGLGKATALGLAQRGFTIVLVARSHERGEAARREIAAASGNDRVELVIADLSSQQAIYALAAAYRGQHDHLHLLVNNAGNSFMTRQISVDGIEMSLAVNHLAPFLLTHLLLPILTASAPARIVNVGSRFDTSMDLDDLQFARRRYNGLWAYAQSKLGNLHFTFELARQLTDSGVTVNCVHPGVFRSNLGRNSGPTPLWLDLITTLARPFVPSATRAAERVLYVATAPELAGVSGRYFGNREELTPPAQILDEAARQQVWQMSAALTGLATPA